jgi:hypothetical protein
VLIFGRRIRSCSGPASVCLNRAYLGLISGSVRAYARRVGSPSSRSYEPTAKRGRVTQPKLVVMNDVVGRRRLATSSLDFGLSDPKRREGLG